MKLSTILANKTQLPIAMLLLPLTSLASLTILSGTILSSSIVSATNDSVVDQVNITVPVSCTMTGTGMDSHSTEIENGLYENNIGTTTLHAFCNDNEGFAIYAAGYTGNEIGGTNSNKLVGTTASSNATIVSGIATTAGNPDLSNWAMKLAISQDSGDTTSTNAFTIDSAPNVDLPSAAEQSATQASFSQYHVVPNEYVKVAHKNSMTDMTASTGGVKLTTTYAAYISKTQPADTYTGQVIYTLVHPASAAAPLPAGKIGVTYNANGSTFTGGATTNNVVYANSPMYIAINPGIAKSSNVTDAENYESYASGINTVTPIFVAGASKLKLVVKYGITADTAALTIAEGSWGGWNEDDPHGVYYDIYSDSENLAGTETYIINGDTATIDFETWNSPTMDYDFGYYAEIYPIYVTEQEGTESSDEFTSFTADTGTYATTTDWYGSWYADINGQHYDFIDESELTTFLTDNNVTLSGTNIDLYRGLTFAEAYTRASKSQDGGYYKQQELTKSMCNTIAITQNQTLKDTRDGNTYMAGKLKDGNCWMLDNLALDPTDSTTAANMNENNTNATSAAINNLLHGGSSITGWSDMAVMDEFSSDFAYIAPMINKTSKDTLVTSYGPAATNGQAKVGLYYNYCAASASTYCYAGGRGVDKPDTIIDAEQDICPANWRMPTGGNTGEYTTLAQKYGNTATETNSLQYNLSTPLSGDYYGGSVDHQGSGGYWWSSTYIYSSYMYSLLAGSTGVDPNYDSNRNFGLSMRCLVSE